MKNRLVISAVILCALLLGLLSGCGSNGEKPLADLKTEDVVSADIYLVPPGSTITISDGDVLSELVGILNELVIYQKDNSSQDTGQLVQVTVTNTDSTTVEVGAYNPFLYLDGVCYKTEYEPCEALNAFGNSLFNELPDKGTPPEPAVEVTTTAEYAYKYANMSLKLPSDWDYSISEDSEDAATFGISFWPEQYPSGKLNLYYYVGGFGVCGTGLFSEPIEFENGSMASMGTYDDHEVWDFISFQKTPGNYVVLNEGAEVWWSEYGEKAMDILNTAQLGAGILYEDGAVGVAEKVCTVEYDTVRATFDLEQGVWEVHFYMANTAGDDQIVWVNANSEILDTAHGE